MTSDEDEAWQHVQRIESLNRKRQIENQVQRLEQDMQSLKERVEVKYVTLEDFNEPAKTAQEFYDELRDNVIEEVAQHIEKLTGFGKDTVDGLTIYIRKMKHD
jgi:protein-tyrosine-phosphatase